MRTKIVYILCLYLCSVFVCADDTYFVYLHDKQRSPYSLSQPELFLSERALFRRESQHLDLDSTDLPVSPAYLDSLRRQGARVIHTSRWLNGATIEACEDDIEKIKTLPFVDSLECTNRHKLNDKAAMPKHRLSDNETELLDYGFAEQQTRMIGLDKLHEAGHNGNGMLIAVVDNGFLNVDQRAAFSHVREHIIDTLNLVPEVGSLFSFGNHGTYVLSIMAAVRQDTTRSRCFRGAAIDADYALIRSEDDIHESLLEVDNQVVAFEFADSIGADIINSSLGYYHFDDTTSNFSYLTLDGRTARNSLAATMAARKGMILCIAAGNEAQSEWRYICTPADADSILTIGSVDSLRTYSAFSSIGPTADGRIKPDIATMGSASGVVSVDGNPSRGNGTSFASPLAAAMVACLWAALPNLTNMQLIELIKTHASQANAPDIRLGWGIPNAWECYSSQTHSDIATPEPTVNDTDNNTLFFDLMGRQVTQPKQGIFITIKNGKVQKIALTE